MVEKLDVSQRTILVLFLVVIFLYSFNQINNSDTFYDLKTGQYILQNFQIPHYDIYSSSANGALWVPHEWLAQIIFYLIYQTGGFLGLIIFAALLSVLTYFILLRLAIRKGADFYLSVLLLFLLSYLTLELWVPRPQIFAYFSLALLIYFLESYRQQPAKKYLFSSLLTIWFWANVNASFILGLTIVIFYFLAEAVKNHWPGKFGPNLDLKKVRNLGWLALGSVLIALLTPANYQGFLYGPYIQPTAAALNVLEWKPITVFWYEIQAKVFTAILFLIDVFFVWWFGFRKESRDLTFVGLALGVSLLPFISIRHAGFWSLAILAPALISLSNMLGKLTKMIPASAAFSALFVFGIVVIFGRLFWMPKKLINENLIPVAAANFIRENNLRGPLFNLYNEGGYLIFRLWPQDRVFIDGRSEVYRGQPLADFFAILYLQPGWQKLIDEKYKINYFFFSNYYYPHTEDVLAPFTAELLKNNFRFVYWNDDAVILVRNTPENSEIIKKYGLRYVEPFYNPAEIPPSEAKVAAAEIQSLLERYPDSLIVRDYARRFLAGH